MNHRVRRFQPADREGMVAFAQSLPEHDLLFLGRDLRQPRVIEAWLSAIEEGWIDSLIAEESDASGRGGAGGIVGTAALVRDPLGWSAHVGEVRLLVATDRRGVGLGRDLLEGVFAIASSYGLAKLTAAMTPDQAGSVALFESLGFRAEALLRDHVRDREGVSHDLAILSYDAVKAAPRKQSSQIERAAGIEADAAASSPGARRPRQ